MMDEESAQRGVTVTLSPDLRDDGWGEEGHQIWAPAATAAQPKPATGNCSLSLPSMSSICSLAMACSRRWKPVTGCCSLSWFSICSLSMAFASFQRVNLLAFLVSDSSTRPVDQPKTDSYGNKSSANHCLNQGGTRQIGPLIFVGPICKNQWIKLICGYQELYYSSTYSTDIYASHVPSGFGKGVLNSLGIVNVQWPQVWDGDEMGMLLLHHIRGNNKSPWHELVFCWWKYSCHPFLKCPAGVRNKNLTSSSCAKE